MMMQKDYFFPCSRAGWHDDGDNQTEETDGFSENENQDHAHKELGLDSIHADSNISYDTDCETWGLKNN